MKSNTTTNALPTLLASFLFLLFTTIPYIISGQTVVLTEDFGPGSCSLPTGWSDTGADPFIYSAPNYSAGVDHTTGTGCFAAHDDSSDDGNGELISPSMDLSAASSAELTFWLFNQLSAQSANDHSSLYVDVSTDGGSNFTNNVGSYTTKYHSWTEITLDISAYTSAQTVLRFRTVETNNFYSDVSLDDIEVTAVFCTPPSPSFTIDNANCGAGDFDIIVNLAAPADMGDADNIIITDNQGNTFDNGGAGYIFTDFPVTIGSYTAGTNVIITLDDDNVSCPFSSTNQTEDCGCSNTPTATVTSLAPDCGASTFNIEITVDSDGDGNANMSDILIDGVLVQADATVGNTYTFNRSVGSYDVTIAAEGTGFVTCISTIYNATASCNNDECAEAFTVTTDGTPKTSLDVTTYTDSGNNLSCDGGSSNEDAYYKFIAPSSGIVVITADDTNLSGTNTQYIEGAIYASCADAASNTEVFCANWSAPFNDGQMVTGLIAGNTYYLEIEHYNNDWTGTYDISIFDPAPPIITGVQECGDFSVNTGDYTDTQTGGGCEPCSSSDPDWWTTSDVDMVWTYIPTANGTVDISVTDIANWDSGDNFTPEMGFMFTTDLNANCPTDVLAYGCNDNFTATKPDLTATGISVVAGTTYYLVVAQEGSSTNNRTGTFCVQISAPCTGTTETISTPAFDCTAGTYTGRINFSTLGGGTTYELEDDMGTVITGVTTSIDYDFNYTGLLGHTLTLKGYDGSSNIVCTQEFDLESGCNGTDIAADALDITNTCLPGNLTNATREFTNDNNGPNAFDGDVSGFGTNSFRYCDNASDNFDNQVDYRDIWYQIDNSGGSDNLTLSITGLGADEYIAFALYSSPPMASSSTANNDNLITFGWSNRGLPTTGLTGSFFSATQPTAEFTGLASEVVIYVRLMSANPDANATCADIIQPADFTICTTVPQPNDECNGAINITTNNLDDTGVASTGNFTAAADEGRSYDCTPTSIAGGDLWYEVLYPDVPSVIQTFFTELSLTGAAGDEYIINVLDVTAACGSALPASIDYCETITLTGGTDVTTLGNLTSTDGQSREIQIIAVNATAPVTVEANVTYENNTCSHFQNVLPGYDITNPQPVNFNYSTDSGADPVTAGNDLWFQFSPNQMNDQFMITASTSADVTVSGLTGDQEITILTYLGNGISANNCTDLAGDYLSSITIDNDGTTVQGISCLDETHLSTDGGYLIRVVQTAGSTIATPTVTITPSAPGPSNNSPENICSGTNPSIGAAGNPNTDAAHNWNPYWIFSGETVTSSFVGANDCGLSAMCSGTDFEAISEVNDRDLWYIFEVPDNQCATLGLTQSTVVSSMNITYDAGNAFRDGVAYVYSACDTSTPLDCSGSLDGEGETWTVNGLTQGEFYLLRVKPWDIAQTPTDWTFDVSVNDGNPAPCNDRVDDAEALTVNTNCSSSPWYPSLETFSAQGARDEETSGQNDVFFKFTAPLPANGGAYNPQVSPTYPGPERSWVNVFLENVSGHIIQMELWNTQTVIATATQYSTSSTAGDKIWARFGNLEPGEEYEIRLYHGETVTTDVQYKIRVEAGDNDNTVTDCDAPNFAGNPILCGSCGGENSTPYITDPAVSSLNSSGTNNHCEIWYKIDLPVLAGGSGTYWVAEVEGYEQILDFELRQQIATESVNHGTQEDFDHPCSSRQLSSSMGTLVGSYPVTYELLNNAPTYSSIMLNGMGSSATECTVGCTAAEATSRGGGFRKVYRDILGPAAGTKNYLYLRVFMDENDPSYVDCRDGGVMINPASVLFRGPYSTDPTTGVGSVVPGAPDLSCAVVADWDNDGIPDVDDLDDDNDGIPDNIEGTDDSDGDGIADNLDLDSDDDGIPDIIEAGGIDADGNGLVDNITGTTLDNDNDGDGWADAYDNDNNDDTTAGTPNILNSDLDTDNDGENDFVDLDADNDGIPDIQEAHPTGNVDPDNDGMVGSTATPCTDADNDGFCDIYDNDDTPTNGSTSIGFSAGSPMFTMITAGQFTCGTGVICNLDATAADANPNHLDIDADNDGIVDIIEAGGTDADGNGMTDTPDTDNGWADALEGSGNGHNLPNTDSQGLANWLDIDADDDGIVDNVEVSSTASYTAPSNMDSDNDGLDDQYDNFSGFGGVGAGEESDGSSIAIGNTNAAYNHDSDSTPDYLDLDSDDDGVNDVDEAWDGTDIDDVSDITGCGTTDIDNDGLLDCYDSDTGSPTVTSYNTMNDNGFNGGSTTASITTSGDTPDDIFPDNDGIDTEADWRDNVIVVPVELLSFDAKEAGKANLLTWATASEENTDKFIIERSANGPDGFERIGDINAEGFSTSYLEYSILDENPLVVSYYRLKIIDFDGSFEYSEIVLVKRSSKELSFINLLPNPSKGEINVSFEAPDNTELTFTITDVSGKIIQRHNSISSENGWVSFDLRNYPIGVYFITMNDDISSVTEKILIVE